MHTPYIVMLLTILELLYKDCLAFLVHVHLSASVRLPSISLQRISLVSSSIARQFPCRWLLVTAAPPRSTSVGPMSRANVPRLPGLALPTLTDVLALEICYSRRHDFKSCSFLASLSAANVESPIYLPSAVFPFAVHLCPCNKAAEPGLLLKFQSTVLHCVHRGLIRLLQFCRFARLRVGHGLNSYFVL